MVAKKLVMKRLLRGQAAKTVLEVLVITFPFNTLILHDERLCLPGVFTMIQVVAERGRRRFNSQASIVHMTNGFWLNYHCDRCLKIITLKAMCECAF